MEIKDTGKWTCLVSVVNGSEVTTAEGHSQVSQAQKPTAVRLTGPFGEGKVANISLYDSMKVNCTVDNARPKPAIAWYVNEMELKDVNTTEAEDEMSYTQTLDFIPGNNYNSIYYLNILIHIHLKKNN
jgi:hypothetical protein